MLSVCLVLLVSAAVLSESVRETETWTPLRSTQPATPSRERHEASGDSPNGSDFGFTDDYDAEDDEDEEDGGDYYPDTLYDEEEEYDGFSGSGDGETASPPPASEPEVNDNKIPEAVPAQPAGTEPDLQNHNEIPAPKEAAPAEEPSNVLMSHAGDDSVFNKTEVLAALIAGGAVGLMLAVLLVLLLIYRLKKKDEGSYDLGRKPIYKKTPTTEIYA
ncbi:syndecan-4 isoform X2 [Pseudoliparis swirei]|uniref:syndecan-4 isoform X2 n=1 Tax=Pseudoliparis swirei TaxID=2059687 RepID=UPI0024BE93BD|nr:syndecan-4 isoform X2 [Pseudoliparis swirei]